VTRKTIERNEPLRTISELTVEFLEARKGDWLTANEVGDFVHGQVVRRLESGVDRPMKETYDGGHWPTPDPVSDARGSTTDAEPVRAMVHHILREMALDDKIECRLFAPSSEGRAGGFLYSAQKASRPR
jgi:hypothetical protein